MFYDKWEIRTNEVVKNLDLMADRLSVIFG